ncbi:anti-sigma factor antagonist [Candidatus Desantisbacteria bacterium]|nr:anti-sigma factor antagonist [Candidatus Desantisbacteria bacterium]
MEIKTDIQENTKIIMISGSLDGKTAPEAQEKIIPLIEPDNILVVDLSNCKYVSSAGLRLLLMIAKQVPSKNCKLFLTGLTEEVKDVMDMTGFSNFFKIYGTVKEACDMGASCT